jgi:hypothetical protein
LKIKLTPTTKEYEVWYGGEKATVTIKQATQADFIRVQELYSDTAQVLNDDGVVEFRIRLNAEEIKRQEVACTLVDADIEDESGAKLFRSELGPSGLYLKMTPSEFNAAWGKLPPALAADIHDCVSDMNPDWTNGKKSKAI